MNGKNIKITKFCNKTFYVAFLLNACKHYVYYGNNVPSSRKEKKLNNDVLFVLVSNLRHLKLYEICVFFFFFMNNNSIIAINNIIFQ